MRFILTNPRTFVMVLLALNVCAALAYYHAGDIRRGIYWTAAAALNATLVF